MAGPLYDNWLICETGLDHASTDQQGSEVTQSNSSMLWWLYGMFAIFILCSQINAI